VLGGLIIRRKGEIQVPECIQGLGQYVSNYNNLVSYYKRNEEERIAAEKRKQDEIIATENAKKINEQKRLKAEEDEKLKKMLQDKNLEMIYSQGTFVIGKNPKQQLVYIRDGVVKNKSEVKDELNLYEQNLALQQRMEREIRDLRAKNLAYRWVVQAQAVCPSGYRCWIKDIREIGRDDDGSLRFSISHERWRGTGGSAGSTSIVCGFNNSNEIRTTSVHAVCQ